MDGLQATIKTQAPANVTFKLDHAHNKQRHQPK